MTTKNEAELSHEFSENEEQFNAMFTHKSKLSSLVIESKITAYKKLFYSIKKWQETGELPIHPHDDYLGGSELAQDIYKKKYLLKDLSNKLIETRPEQMFRRLAAYIASVEDSEEKQELFAKKFYNLLYNGYFLPGGRVIAGAGDLFRLKTLANCFVSIIEKDNIESIYKAAYECARTYSYGGGIGVDISVLRPKNSVVHNAADHSTGAVSFMEVYSLTTGLIGQSGRRGALMLTMDVKHPDVFNFIKVKKESNWVTKQIIDQCRWSNKFQDHQLDEIEKKVRENTQVRFANISLKVTDEFMQAVYEQTMYGKEKILVYKKLKSSSIESRQDEKSVHYAYSIPSKEIEHYELLGTFDTIESLNQFLEKFANPISKNQLDDVNARDIYGDLTLTAAKEDFDISIKRAGDFLLYYHSKNVGEIKELVKARDIWDPFISSNYQTAEPGLIFWSRMKKYSPSDYLGKPILSTNPCGEVPLEDGGACNLGSLNLSRFVKEGYTENASVDWESLKEVTYDVIRFLDNVVLWNETLNPLEKQRRSAHDTRRLGLGIMGIADMFNQLGIDYDSEKGINLLEKISSFVANHSYRASAHLAEEKAPSPIFNYGKYKENPFFNEAIDDETRTIVKEKGLRNVAILSIAPTGTISNVILSYKNKDKHYVGVSSGIEPVFALYYTRRSESFGNKMFKVFHSTVKAYLDKKGKTKEAEKIEDAESLRSLLPDYFFRTAHFISAEKRVEIQGVAQKYIDHSISSTVNLPESVDPETISNIYVQAWKKGLKGITIYRDGSRYPILSVQTQQTKFQNIKNQVFTVKVEGQDTITLKGDEVFTTKNGTLCTPFHAVENNIPEVKISEIEKPAAKPKKDTDKAEKTNGESSKVCKVELVDGQLVKSCSE
ncbi:MAG: adenosylcobalamin-dependent ribonucleoside-diphosphate reductase [Candidatus Woesearchaeota archaeon]|jgi:ribonucleoside-diphosphate reductase alpha chain|nr:adenosylcobalamin-dependent ribonucleoside-diphosphate reductase [Candidatus Woesearchaeota archaeon]MDP7324295.1 adenosylcobalamin-dependent ribonucleoside-diphosphate reductase [Candidatus Woesearchaeota archaeon]MDP7457272.1 adenosylcobalamin-dependent ribonucleoside-diphosphate reductase [Candidatus Woesearchaeota archaeon]